MISQVNIYVIYIVWILCDVFLEELFGDGKDGLLFSQKVDGKMIFTGYWEVFVLNFSVMGSTVFYAVKKSWWKDDIYWLLRSSCFELFGNGKYGLFSTKKLMERWYLRGLFELSMILQDLENMVFRAVTAQALSQHWFSFILKIIGLNVQLLQVCLSIIHPRILSFRSNSAFAPYTPRNNSTPHICPPQLPAT